MKNYIPLKDWLKTNTLTEGTEVICKSLSYRRLKFVKHIDPPIGGRTMKFNDGRSDFWHLRVSELVMENKA